MNATSHCASCGTAIEAPAGGDAAAFAAEESARCARLGELREQRNALAIRMQAGFAGVLDIDTADLVAQRQSLAKLDAALHAEHDEIARAMRHARP